MSTLSEFPEDHLYEQVGGSFNYSSLTQTYKLVKCRMCAAAISHDDDSLTLHQQFHADLAELASCLKNGGAE